MTMCPHCSKPFDGEHCNACGCTATVNPVSKNIVYMIRGRVVGAPSDLREQWAKKSGLHRIVGPDPINEMGEPVKGRDQ